MKKTEILLSNLETADISDLIRKYSPKLSHLELLIVDARVNSEEIKVVSKEDLKLAIIKVSFISGSALPKQKHLAELLLEEIFDFLTKFGYADYTIEELVLAFQLNCVYDLKLSVGVEVNFVDSFGSFLSVAYVAKVLSNYKQIRNVLDGKLRNSVEGY